MIHLYKFHTRVIFNSSSGTPILAGYLKTSSGWFLVSFSLPLKVYPAIFVLHESAVAYKPLDTTINAVCFAENIEILG